MIFKKKDRRRLENEMLLRKLDGRAVECVSVRNLKDYSETIIGRDGVINIFEDQFIIICGNKIVFRHPVSGLKAGEFMSLEGINISYRDEKTGEDAAIVVYYKYYRKLSNKKKGLEK